MLLAGVCGQPTMLEDAAIAAWRSRYNTFSSVEYIVEGTLITTPEFITGLGVPTQEMPDRALPIKMHAKIDFTNRRGWLRREQSQWTVPLRSFRPMIIETTTNGGRSRVMLQERGDREKSTRLIDKEVHTWQINKFETLPIWLSSGIFEFEKPGFSTFDESALRTGWVVIPDDRDRTEGLIRVARSPRFDYFVGLNARKNYVAESIQCVHRGEPSLETNVSYTLLDDEYIPKRWETSVFASGRLILHLTLDVKRFRANCAFPDALFMLEEE